MNADGAGSRSHDVVIAGGGPVGATLALALAGAGASVALVERRATPAPPASDAEARPIALSEGSRRIFATLGLWQRLAAEAAPIRTIHVSDRGHFGTARLHAADYGVEALGHVVDASRLGAILAGAVREHDAIELLAPADIRTLRNDTDAICCALGDPGESHEAGQMLRGALLVVADGGRSALGESAGLHVRRRDGVHGAVTAVVTPRDAHRDTAYERFTEQGPMALLPLAGNRCGLVWTCPLEQAEQLHALDDAAFLARLEHWFGGRLGGFAGLGRRTLHRLSRLEALRTWTERVVLIGNAAHVLHPVAGQGLNLGLRDVAWLAEEVAEALRNDADPGSRALLARYAAHRRLDQRVTGLATDLLVQVFSNRAPPLALARAAGLFALDVCQPLKTGLVRRAMGLHGTQPRLARGLPA